MSKNVILNRIEHQDANTMLSMVLASPELLQDAEILEALRKRGVKVCFNQ